MNRLPLALSCAALVVAVLGWTGLGGAARVELAKVVPFAAKAKYAQTAGTANNAKALGGHKASAFPLLDSSGKLPASIVSPGVASTAGPKGTTGATGPAGATGATGAQGAQGASGVVAAYTKSTGDTPFQSLTGSGTEVVTLSLPAGRYVLLGQVTIGRDTTATYFANCKLAAGEDFDQHQAAGQAGGAVFGEIDLVTIHQFAAAGAATIACNDSTILTSKWSNARLTAIQVAGSLNAVGPVTKVPGTGTVGG